MSTDLANVKPSFLTELPAYDMSEMNKFCAPPRLKIIQALTSAPFKPPFKDGDAVVIPQMVKVADVDTAFTFTPVLFFASYVCWNPAQLKSQLPAIREISFEDDSEVARKARNFVREKCPENKQFELKYAQMLNFLIVVHDNESLTDLPIAMFFNRGEFRTGQTLIGLIQSLKAPPYAGRFRAGTSLHTGKLGSWFGLDIEHDVNRYVSDEATFRKYEKLHDDLKKLVASRQLQVDLNDSDVPQDDGKF